MKFFIFMCCTAHLLTGISSRIRRTTPMPSALRSNDAEARRVMKFADMIDFVNSDPNNNDGNIFFRRHGLSRRKVSRRLNEVMAAMYGFANLKQFHDVDNMAAAKEIEEIVRHHIIDNPDVLMEHRAKQKNDNMEGILDPGNAHLDEFKLVTADPVPTVHVRAQDDVQELTTDETTYRPSFPDDEDHDKPIMDDIKLINNKNENKKPKTDGEYPVVPPKMNKTDEFQKRIHNTKRSSKADQAPIDKNADTHDSKKASTQKENNKEYKTTKFIYSQEKLNEDRIRRKDKVEDTINKENGDTNENSRKDKNLKDKSWVENKKNPTSEERLNFDVENKIHDIRDRSEQYSIYSHKERRENSGKHFKKSGEEREKYNKKKKDKYHDKRGERESEWIKVDNQRDYKESLRENNDDKRSKKEKELDKNYDRGSKTEKDWDKTDERWSKKDTDWGDIDEKFTKKEKFWDKNDERLSKKDKDLDKIDERWSKKDTDWGDIDYKFTKKEKKWDKNDERWSKKHKNFDKNDDSSSKKEKTRDKNDERWTKKEKYWNNKKNDHEDKEFDRLEYEWNKRHQEYDKQENDAQWDDNDSERNEKSYKERDSDFKKRDNEFNKRDNDWTKRDSGGNKNWDRIYDRNEPGNKKSYENVYQDRYVRHDRYKIVERVDSDSSRNDDYARYL